ncbi:uncharacterized protein LOC111293428, partial [Durio zibethinus]|uniref:Uncharacterized protein LOC111293428 n=1 Tax=Durio zibethinus TaxID=66656 RepID=A0A6P5YN02_DURZI
FLISKLPKGLCFSFLPLEIIIYSDSVTADTTTLSYWFNWRVLLCSIIVLTPIVMALFLIWKYEGLKQVKCDGRERQEDLGCDELYDDDVWRPCLQKIHPLWLLGYRVVAFCLALATVKIKVVVNDGCIYYYYTPWTFTLVTIYFGFGTLLSIYGCYQHKKMSSCDFDVDNVRIDSEQGYYMPLTNRNGTNVNSLLPLNNKIMVLNLLVKIVLMNAGAVMPTDSFIGPLFIHFFPSNILNLI